MDPTDNAPRPILGGKHIPEPQIDWLLIRAILHREPLDEWEQQTVFRHLTYCEDKKWIEALEVRDGEGQTVEFFIQRKTSSGNELAAALFYKDRLEAAIATLEAQGITSDIEDLKYLLCQ